MTEEPKLEIFFDGSCAFCRAVQESVERRDTRQRLKFVDYNDPTIAASAPFPRERLDAEMHVRKPDGAWAVGFEGWAAVLLELPRYKWLGWLFGVFPLHELGPGVYRWVAKHRYRIPGFPPPCKMESCGVGSKPVPKSTAIARPHSR